MQEFIGVLTAAKKSIFDLTPMLDFILGRGLPIEVVMRTLMSLAAIQEELNVRAMTGRLRVHGLTVESVGSQSSSKNSTGMQEK